ncbi:MAG: DUF4263 domain-containing protein [Thermoplasmata archaeon]|nr:DUF4263 domain-containing protein [Thermoplasmata archaeon]
MFSFAAESSLDPMGSPSMIYRIRARIQVPGPSDPFERWGTGSTLASDNLDGLFEMRGRTEVRFVDLLVAHREDRQTRVDLFPLVWFMQELPETFLDELRGERIATMDAASWVLGLALDPPSRGYSLPTLQILRTKVETLLGEYSRLISLSNVEEEEVQRFLRDHPYILDPSGSVKPKYSFGGELVSDFLIDYPDGSYRFVEIERPHDSVSTSAGLSARTSHAVDQVRSWASWIRAQSDPLASKTARAHWVIIGRRALQTSDQVRGVPIESLRREGIEIRYFDDLSSNLDAALDRLLLRGEALRRRGVLP